MCSSLASRHLFPFCRVLLPRYLLLFSLASAVIPARSSELFIRANQLGYKLREPKIAIVFGEAFPGTFDVVSKDDNRVVFTAKPRPLSGSRWGKFEEFAELDFSAFTKPGSYFVRMNKAQSLPFTVSDRVYDALTGQLLEFMRQQRCGYNPWLNAICHPHDGRTAYGPAPDGTQLDVTGGWHDAADLLKYQLTSGNATAQMLLAYELARGLGKRARTTIEADEFNALGQPGSDGVPDLLNEARWGLDWLLKLHPAPDQLYHQVADDRDHSGWRLPQNETADYGWGKGGARVVYFADGHSQGLKDYKSQSTGLANLAGRYAAAMALEYQIWKHSPSQKTFAQRCLQAGIEVYELGRAHEGVQQGNSYGAPYRYEETTWADDMEWGAAELYRATRETKYLADARQYAQLAADESWMGKEQPGHYQFYPFMNPGHFRLYDLVDRSFQRTLAHYYRQDLERCLGASRNNTFEVGIPFIWCSNNLLVALVTQCLLYEQMTGDKRFHVLAAKNRDWLLGRNPWGYAMFTGIGNVFPRDPHLMTVQLTKRPVIGGLVDGPVYERIFKSLKGVSIREPDPLAAFQGPAVYHDDFHDYSSNEPTTDGTASAILMWVLLTESR